MTMTTARHQAIPTHARESLRKSSTDSDLTPRFVREVVPLRETLCRHAFSLRRNYSDTEDLVQETMLKAYLAFQSLRSGTTLWAWLLRILINSYINHYRKARRHPMLYSTEEMTDEHLAQVSARRTATVLHSAEQLLRHREPVFAGRCIVVLGHIERGDALSARTSTTAPRRLTIQRVGRNPGPTCNSPPRNDRTRVAGRDSNRMTIGVEGRG
jgi:hypothetical protein